MNTVLFVCTANQNRSPVAEALLKRRIEESKAQSVDETTTQPSLGTGSWIVRSAGTWAQTGYPATPRMIEAAAEVGLDLTRHHSCTVEDVQPLTIFKLVLTMEQGQKEALQMEFPNMANRIYCLTEMIDLKYDIEDPIGKKVERFRETIQEIDGILWHGFARIRELSSSIGESIK
ncbi:MAG: hypothetical protein AAF702_18655 [Chloroflexota bacterium]